ncbi:MAG: hypothetical protein U5K37_08465 [Natrialbaceae archaeon]|nr:hypothetical protein [Natrialbaceae archaeon]
MTAGRQVYDPNHTPQALDALAIVTTGTGPASIPVAHSATKTTPPPATSPSRRDGTT